MNADNFFTPDGGRRVRYLAADSKTAPLLLTFLAAADNQAFAERLAAARMPSENRRSNFRRHPAAETHQK